jgi:hypothetical protein
MRAQASRDPIAVAISLPAFCDTRWTGHPQPGTQGYQSVRPGRYELLDTHPMVEASTKTNRKILSECKRFRLRHPTTLAFHWDFGKALPPSCRSAALRAGERGYTAGAESLARRGPRSGYDPRWSRYHDLMVGVPCRSSHNRFHIRTRVGLRLQVFDAKSLGEVEVV